MTNIPETLLRNRLFIAVLILFTLGAAGCISQQPEMLKVNPVIDSNPLEGFYGKSEGMFTVIKGSIPEVKESLKEIVIEKAPQQSTFSIDDELNFVVFRGVFSSGGYGIDIDRVERQGSAFTVYATYIDPGEGILVTGAVTQPVAIIPIGRLAEGDYEVRLRVKKVKADADGTKIVRKVVEPEKELSAFNFKVKTPEETIYYYTETGGFNQTQASIVWNIINGSDEAKFVISEKSYSAVIFMHPYTVGVFDPSTAEWVVVISSIPEKAEETKIAIFRLDYQTFDLKKSNKFNYPSRKELTLEESIAIIEEEMKKDPYGTPYGNRPVEKEMVSLHGGNYIYSYPATDFGGTIIVNKYAGRAIFYATTVWSGKGEIIIPEAGESDVTPSIPNIPIIGVESFSSPAYRGTSTNLKLFISGNNITKGTEISLDYKTLLLHTDGHFESNPTVVELIPEKKRLVFPQTVKAWDVPEKLLYSNLTINLSPYAADGSYYITMAAKYKGLEVGSGILSFKIGKGGKMYLQGRSEEEEKLLHMATWNIGYERYQSPPLNDTEREDARAIAINDSYLKGRKYNITEITSESYDLQNFYGFLPVVTVDIGEPDKPGEIVRYTIDLEEKKIFRTAITPRKPLVEYFAGKAFDESAGNLTKRWSAENFAGFWHEPGTDISTEILIIDQKVLNSTHRVIEKHNLIYTTSPVFLKYNVYTYANRTPSGTEGNYPAIGWLGEKYVFLPGDRLAKIIFEQNATEVKTMVVGEIWKFGEGYKIYINSIDAKAAARQGWLSLFKDNNKIDDVVFPHIYIYTYPRDANYSIPIFVTYISNMRSLADSDAVDFRYTWLRSQNITEIKEGDIFGIMEVTSVKNGTIELRNKEPIKLTPGAAIRLMGNMSIQVGGSETYLLFYPTMG
jgi:S-layer protein (TIGR01567 family)